MNSDVISEVGVTTGSTGTINNANSLGLPFVTAEAPIHTLPRPTRTSFAETLKARQTHLNASSPLQLATSRPPVPPARISTPQARIGGYTQVFSPSLLDSPVMLSTNQAEPSPTTGTFPIHPYRGGGGLWATAGGNVSQVSQGKFEQLVAKAGLQKPPGTSSAQAKFGLGTLPEITRITPAFTEKPAEDGYNWRKYGQKVVKGSEHPRSYFKCTYPGCDVKKKVFQSDEGDVIERVYKGSHSHPRPTPARKVSIAQGSSSEISMALKNANGQAFDEDSRYENGKGRGAWEARGGDANLSSDDSGDEEGLKRGDMLDGDHKRRKHDNPAALKAAREPRLVIQATSEVEILDDGYRWRKYGQKVVKGNPHPRSYYKCTSPSCPVRKHVERSSKDPKIVVTTYEGKHNHDVPATRGLKEEHETQPASNWTDPSWSVPGQQVDANLENLQKVEANLENLQKVEAGNGNGEACADVLQEIMSEEELETQVVVISPENPHAS